MDLKWILLTVFCLVVVLNHQVIAEIESRQEVWSSRGKDYRSKVGQISAWDELFKRYYMEDIKSEETATETETDFYYNHPRPKPDELEESGLKCVPGRTIIRLEEKKIEPEVIDSGDEEEQSFRRSHMNTKIDEQYCKVCICSVQGNDEYCSGRPAMNVNECIRMSTLMEQYNSNSPYDHSRVLAYRIRRDYIWHNDEIPYEAKAKCRRGTSYYSNSINANDTDIDVASDVESLLDYSNKTVCFYCVCTVTGREVGCINRTAWFCEYFRHLREDDHPRDTYNKLFKQDRPAYFRQLSWRLRRTMDDKLYEFANAVGDYEDSCTPFVSEYTDCTEENQCNGCNKCVCDGNGKWDCTPVHMCRSNEVLDINLHDINNAMVEIVEDIGAYSRKSAATSRTPFVPRPSRDQDLLLDDYQDKELDVKLATLLRNKRSTDEKNSTNIKFYHTVDEINEDTLKNGSLSGTLQAQKVSGINYPKISRRTDMLTGENVSESTLHIAYNEPNAYDPHLTDNKIEAVHHDDQYNTVIQNRMHTIIGNHTQKQKDKELSKLVVNELKLGKEVIGDVNAKVMSNITFTPENDTLTAMAFIAGNLLNQLWNMEKESGEDSRETETLKHEKISDLLELFKEPLNLRQENFLKNALKHLSEAIDKDKNLKNVSLCEKIEESKKYLRAENETTKENKDDKDCDNNKIEKKESSSEKNLGVATETITKIDNVLNLINKFQKVQKNLIDLKQKSSDVDTKNIKRKAHDGAEAPNKLNLSQDESSSLNVFGNILEKITKLLLPPKRGKKIVKNIRSQNVLRNPKDLAKNLKTLYNIDVDSSNLSPKDQLIFDYLTTVKRNPNCILDNLRESNQSPITKIEGDILLNLSEFFKVKSFVDLLNLVEPGRTPDVQAIDVTTKIPQVTTKITTTTMGTTIPTTKAPSKKLSETKEKLKSHLKTIIDDLIEIQNAKGYPTNNISIVDALPCIFKILNADENTQDKLSNIEATTESSPVDKVATIFNTLKEELISAQNRRSGIITGERPKSAIVWERVIKNVDFKKKGNTRRNLELKEPKAFDELKKLMDEADASSKTYKNDAFINGVHPAERLVLLKTLSSDVKQYINVLEEIENFMTNLESLTAEKKIDVYDFVDNAATNIRLNDKLAKNINKLKVKSRPLKAIEAKMEKKPREDSIMHRQSMKLLDVSPSHERKNIKLSRDSIINQLIKNRMQLFVKEKESKNIDLDSDINYSIAKKILAYLEIGNYTLARELYKVIVSQKQKTVDVSNAQIPATSAAKKLGLTKEPMVQFEEPRGRSQLQWLNQDIWLKQLSNLKNMKA